MIAVFRAFLTFGLEDGTTIGTIHVLIDSEADSNAIQKFADLCCKGYKNSKVAKIFSDLYLESEDPRRVNSMKIFPATQPNKKQLHLGSFSMILQEDGSVGSKFLISLKSTSEFDERQVVIGRVVKGIEIIIALGHLGSRFGRPKKVVLITSCGMLKWQISE
jgi:cyclophilin family peptidyl-prolyl cis-trans isomerase